VELLREFAEPFDRMTAAEASAMLSEHYAVRDAELDLLDTERDDTYRVKTPTGTFVLKVAHPDDDPLYVNLQTAAMSFAGEDATLPLQRLVLSVDGEIEPVVDGRVVRLLTWLEGTPLHLVRPTADELEALGSTLGALSAALASFDHPAAHREFVWDCARLPLVRPLLDEYPSPEVEAAFALFDERVAPLVSGLPQQVIHNDFHLGNVLVNPGSDDYVAGIIDFGDVVHTARVVDLAVSLSYFIYPSEHPKAELDRFIAGFESRVPLRDDEREALPGLIAARLAQRILVNQHLGRGNPADRAAAAASATQTRLALAAYLEQEH